MTAENLLALAGPDDEHTQAEWEQAAATALRKARRLPEGAPDSAAWGRLTHTTLDGIAVAPLGTVESVRDLPPVGAPGHAPFTRGRLPYRPEHGWDIRSHVGGLDPKRANEEALLDLEGGVTSLWLQLGGQLTPTDLSTVLKGVLLDVAPVIVDAPDPLAAARALVAVAEDQGIHLHQDSNLGCDPIGAAVRADGHPRSAGQLTELAEVARSAGVRAIVVDATVVHDLGASDGQELGYSLAVGAAYLRALTAAGQAVDDALPLIEFRYAATDEQFPTIAKLRAARRLWARVSELSGSSSEAGAQRQHAVTSRPMMSRYDPYVNMLRTTVAAFAAGVGGADAVTVLPFDSPLGLPSALGRRNARNTSSLLIAESHVAGVTDPAGGSYAAELLTDGLARAGWAQFQAIEAAGGIEAALSDGSLRGRIDEVAARRTDQVAHRSRQITGLTEFPNLEETPLQRDSDPMARQVRRYGAAFEALRDEPATHPVFLATLGTVAAHTARASFAANLLAAGGIPVMTAGATEGVESLLRAYEAQDEPPVVCVCGTDAAYLEWGAEAVAALRQDGARWVILAGKPGERTIPADLVDDSAAMGLDALAFLTTTREKLA
ncbi:MAG: methylmalonyl-CoA mutase family protein [Intrasporangium sp.]|uniref:methylmalonyl-CoA mutase family protein n=1 Tax=Intrasporangium sp. TaxID=1925024 RepID=UPI0026491D77|nr:methylmalonyl-CoA mutase family protein [Intrasporangium sp.]MDN5796268.1 methylmalonyl-CoA mutase family protein [Intrasporangium sp.]